MDKKITLTEKQLNELASLKREREILVGLINSRTLEFTEYLKKNMENLDPELLKMKDLLLGSMKQYLFCLDGYSNLKREELGITEEFN